MIACQLVNERVGWTENAGSIAFVFLLIITIGVILAVEAMLHHISLPVSNLTQSKRLYDAALEPLGYRCVFATDAAIGYGVEDGKDKLCLKTAAPAVSAGEGFHLALAAPTRQAVDAFYAAALKHGATDNGAPGLRVHYGPTYYAAFIIDLDGHRLEAVHK